MGFIKPTFLLKGAVKEGVNIFEEAEQIGKESVSILKEAKEEVQEEINTVSNNYDKAIALADSAGGGAFGKYLFNYYGNIEQLAGLADLAPEDRTKQLSLIKSEYNNLPDETKAKLSDGDFSEMVDKRYNLDVDRIKSGLVNQNNMGEATANTLIGRVQSMVDKRFQPQREQIMSTVGGRDLRESDPVEGGFESIASPTTGRVDFNTAGPDYFTIKDTVNKNFETYFNSRRFKTANTYTDNEFIKEVGNVVGVEDVATVREKIEEAQQILLGQGISITKEALAMDILKQGYINDNYGDVFVYNGFLNMLDDLVEVNE
jgi:hypothetical protein